MRQDADYINAGNVRWQGMAALLAAVAFGGALGGWLGNGAPLETQLLLAAGAGVLLSSGVLVWCVTRVGAVRRRDATLLQRLSEDLARCRASEAALQRREQFYHTILEDIPEMICRWYPDGRISYVNEAYCRYFQVTREELLKQGGVSLFHPGADRRDAALYRAQPVVTLEFPVTQADGAQRWQRWVDRALFDADGAIREFQSVGEDITARKRAEQETAALLEQNRHLARMVLAIQEEERAHLARELHDELGQSLTAIRAEAECVLQVNHDRSPTISECAASINTVAGQVYTVVRDMMHRLHPALLDDLGLAEALNELLRRWRGHHPEVALEAEVEPPPALSREVELAAYRIVQEALTNIAKHAAASRVELALHPLDGMLELNVRDDGHGFDTQAASLGHGLIGMRERVLATGGEFQTTSAPGMGTTIRATLPLTNRENDHAGR